MKVNIVAWDMNRLDEIVQLWNGELGYDFPMRKELFKQNSFLDENVCQKASRLVVNEHDEVIGFIVAKRWKESLQVGMRENVGWIQTLLVHNNYRGRGIGSKLLSHAESVFKEKGMTEILLGRDPWHYFPGIPESYGAISKWFEKKGYAQFGTDYDMINNYQDKSGLPIPEAKEAKYSLLSLDDKEDFLSFMNRCFPGRWEYEAHKYFENGGTGREFVVLKKAGEIIGFCRMNDSKAPIIAQNIYWAPLFDEKLGGIGPLGVDAKERGNGYGIGIVEAAIAFLRNRGINRIVIDWTGLVEFYGKLGYEKWKTYQSYKKEL